MLAMLLKKQNIRTLSLIIVTLVYLLVGAVVFDSLESQAENTEATQLLAEELNFRTRYNISNEDFAKISTNVLRSVPHKAGIQWKFAGAFYFCTTVITTIGYGHSTPQTAGGKVFCMFYALTGIPLNLVMFQSIGERLNVFTTFLLGRLLHAVRRCRQHSARQTTTTTTRPTTTTTTTTTYGSSSVSSTHLIIVSLTVSSLVVVGGAYVFMQCEGWNYLDSIYYCVITLTTVGFGDMVALQKDGFLQTRPEYVTFSVIFILFGLAVVSAAMNLLVLRFLTMNTDDERKDELRMLAAAAAKSATTCRHNNDDVMSAVRNGKSVNDVELCKNCSVQLSAPSPAPCPHNSSRPGVMTSQLLLTPWRRQRSRYHVTRPPTVIAHLLLDRQEPEIVIPVSRDDS